jgi:hypothetical protein
MVGAALGFAATSQANTSHRVLKCAQGYARRTVRVPERRHGRIVRHKGVIVYTRLQRCVKMTSRSFPPVGTAPMTPGLPPPFSPIVPPRPPIVPPPSPPTPNAPVDTGLPTITGSATEGSTLTGGAGTWTNAPTSYGYQWQRCDAGGGTCQNVASATTTKYLLGNADVGSTLRFAVTAVNASGSASAVSADKGPIGLPTDPVAVAVGDIACSPGGTPTPMQCQQGATEQLAASRNPNAVFVLGDNQYNDGLFSEYEGAGAYNPTWGIPFNPIVHPVPGNHEYAASTAAAGYFQYFGAVAHPPEGYYSFNLGTWHIVALNSNCTDAGCSDALAGGTTSAQLSWLQSDLAVNRSPCVLAMWHHPLFSFGWTLGTPPVAPLWTALYNAHADVVLNGHDHLYERYAQQDPNGIASTNGILEFVVGTGGESHNGLYGNNLPTNLQAYDSSDFGVLVLTLHASSYSWTFVNTSGAVVDSGATPCHGPGTATAGVAAARAASPAVLARLSGPQLTFDARPLAASLATVSQRGLPVAVHSDRAADLTVTAWLRRGRRLERIASYYETESQIPRPYAQIQLRFPTRWLKSGTAVTLVLRFAAVDSAGHHQAVTRTVSLR